MAEIVTKDRFKNEIYPRLKEEKKTIALSHGVFDLVHPGHIIHFEQASKMADILVVSITAAKYVRKGPDRPFFSDEMRLKFLSSIEYIDYVILSECYTVDDIIEAVHPDLYVKGAEYKNEEADVTGMMSVERALVEKYGGRVAYTGGDVFSSTRLINVGLSGLSEEVRTYMYEFKKTYSLDDLRGLVDKIEALKILVVGDVIIDEYVYCYIQGLMSKDMAYSARLRNSERYLGGSVAVARHIAGFSKNVTLMSVIGDEPGTLEEICASETDSLHISLDRSSIFPTIVKKRFLSKNDKREEYDKVFVINNIPEKWDEDPVKEEFKKKLKESVGDYDAVFLCDFGHGLVDDEIIDIISEKAKYLILNCQTNSSNFGLNNITKYHKADFYTLDQKELKLAFPAYAEDEENGMKTLKEYLKAGAGVLTRGSKGAMSLEDDKIDYCPAFTLTVKDTIGAGDAFYSIAGLFMASGATAELAMFMGNIAGALGANIVGNKAAVERSNVMKYASTLLNV
ncbi:MAG: adenylyltransferase/cytidyltransferase family protein [Lachnospiraceae bacterium]|nr:adenylyltransferase/cytidyltransferase family protein [Lachnospiraceae bacterium]